MKKNTYVLGTGLSHDGSACLLKNGKICVAIEKERLTRKKHDGYNDTQAINYCLDAEGITLDDLTLVVQNANFGVFKFGNNFFRGSRVFAEKSRVPVVTISHHLAHAYSTIGTCPFEEFNVLIIDGTGSPYEECYDLNETVIPDQPLIQKVPLLYAEKDSYYKYRSNQCRAIFKDFSEYGYFLQNPEYLMHPPLTRHSIGGVYDAASRYCFGSLSDAGKLMGLSPYGKPGVFKQEIFNLRDGRVFVNYDWMDSFQKPARDHHDFSKNFQYYADIAFWIQKEVEKAILYVVNSRVQMDEIDNLCFAGGVALNAVTNSKIRSLKSVKNLYIQPAAGDNGLSIGCAYYGWLEVLKMDKSFPSQSTCFGISYPSNSIAKAINAYDKVTDMFFETVSQHYSPAASAGNDRYVRFRIGQKSKPYNLIIKASGLLEYSDFISDEPSCEVTLDNALLYQLAFKPELPGLGIQFNKIKVPMPDDLQILLGMLDFEAISKTLMLRLKKEISAGSGSQPSSNPDYIRKTAEMLAQGKIIGWFQDGSEFGPRALGRRSILADPRNAAARNIINSDIKFREDFRPFAPSVLREDVSTYFHADRESPHMLFVDQIRDRWREKLKSVVHEDGSCRIQTVTEEWNPKYYQLLKEFKNLTGVSVLLNTSFNCRGMPIVETPEEALYLFHICKLDALIIHDFIVEK